MVLLRVGVSIHSEIESLDPPSTEEELYHTIDKITTAIQQASDDHIPVNTIQTHRPRLPPQYLPLIKQSRTFYRDSNVQITPNQLDFIDKTTNSTQLLEGL